MVKGKVEKPFLLVTSPAWSCAFSEKEVFWCCFLADGGWRVCSSASLYLLLGRRKTCLPRIGHFQKVSFVFSTYETTVKIVKRSDMKCTCQLRESSMTAVLLSITWKPLGLHRQRSRAIHALSVFVTCNSSSSKCKHPRREKHAPAEQ